jgi:hypothetical protein
MDSIPHRNNHNSNMDSIPHRNKHNNIHLDNTSHHRSSSNMCNTLLSHNSVNSTLSSKPASTLLTRPGHMACRLQANLGSIRPLNRRTEGMTVHLPRRSNNMFHLLHRPSATIRSKR